MNRRILTLLFITSLLLMLAAPLLREAIGSLFSNALRDAALAILVSLILSFTFEFLYQKPQLESINHAEHATIESRLLAPPETGSGEKVTPLMGNTQRLPRESRKSRDNLNAFGGLQEAYIRLTYAINSATKNGIFSLSIGVALTATAVGILWFSIAPEPPSGVDRVWHYLPRASIVVLVEIFAFFFLGIYKHSLKEIAYLHNELTNVQLRASALSAALNLGDAVTISAVIGKLADTERNFVLNKDQSTVDLERSKIEQTTNIQLMGLLKDLLKRDGK